MRRRVPSLALGAAALLAAVAPLAAGCADSTPSGPPITGTPVTPPPPPPAPTITGPAVLYQRVSPLSHGPSDAYLLSSGTDSTFVMIFPGGGTHWAWSGRYGREGDSVLVFRYHAYGTAGEPAARGTLRGDTLLLRYGGHMQLTDFEDGVYVGAPRAQ